jgi:glutamine synthetase
MHTNHNLDTRLNLVKNADYVLLNFTDLLSSLKGRTIAVEEAKNALDEGVGFGSYSITGGVSTFAERSFTTLGKHNS